MCLCLGTLGTLGTLGPLMKSWPPQLQPSSNRQQISTPATNCSSILGSSLRQWPNPWPSTSRRATGSRCPVPRGFQTVSTRCSSPCCCPSCLTSPSAMLRSQRRPAVSTSAWLSSSSAV